RAGLEHLTLKHLTLVNGSMDFADAMTEAHYYAGACDIVVTNLSLGGATGIELLKRQHLDAGLYCEELRRDNVSLTAVDLVVQARDQVFQFEPVTLEAFGAQGTGNAQLDFSGEEPRYTLKYALPGFQSAAFVQALAPGQTLEGRLDFA